STPTTWWPRASRSAERVEPTYPAEPVTTIFIGAVLRGKGTGVGAAGGSTLAAGPLELIGPAHVEPLVLDEVRADREPPDERPREELRDRELLVARDEVERRGAQGVDPGVHEHPDGRLL